MGQEKPLKKKSFRQIRLWTGRRTRLAEETGADAVILSPRYPGVPEIEFGRLIENYVGVMPVPLGLAENFRINCQDVLVPMATNERTVIAAASHGAKLCRDGPTEGFHVKVDWPRMTGQLLYGGFADRNELDEAKAKIDHWLMAIGGKINGILDRLDDHQRRVEHVQTRVVNDSLLVVELVFAVGETMGGRAVTHYMRTAGGLIKQLAVPLEPTAVICSNRQAGWLVHAHAVWPMDREAVDKILLLQEWAEHDECRMATHRKGIMNGIEAVGLATGQDTRALAAALYAPQDGWPHSPGLTHFSPCHGDGGLVGLMGRFGGYLPLATIGGGTQHPVAKACRQVINANRPISLEPDPASWLAAAMACVGLACNFSALRCLTQEGIPEAFERVRQDD